MSGLDEVEILCLIELVGGDTDEVAARRLGMSRRTFRRRIKQAMDKFEAKSRFQAGYHFASSGAHRGLPGSKDQHINAPNRAMQDQQIKEGLQ